jgi:hypothetical protein
MAERALAVRERGRWRTAGGALAAYAAVCVAVCVAVIATVMASRDVMA